MHATTELLERIEAQRRRIAALEAQVSAYRYSHLGILSGPAIRHELGQIMEPIDLLLIDWRKLHQWNEILGWERANALLGRAARVGWDGVERRQQPRRYDLRGQYGGDELVFAVDAGCGRGLLGRLLAELDTLSAELTPDQRQAIHHQTGGLISGFCIAAVLIEGTAQPLLDAERAATHAGVLKAGRCTGDRATSGARGTVLGELDATR